MMAQNLRSKRQIFVYNQEDVLVTFAEQSPKDELLSYYHLENKILTRLVNHTYKENRKTFKEAQRAIVAFEEECMLSHMNLDGESRCTATKRYSNKLLDPPTPISKVYQANQFIESFTIAPVLINEWLQKL